jgi:hypothetical protein
VPARELAHRLQEARAVAPRIVLSALLFGACRGDQPALLRPPPGAQTGAVTIHAPPRLEGLATGELDAAGRPVRVGCATCHALRAPGRLPTSAAELDEFHQGLVVRHGELACAACHVAGDQRSLHRADGTLVDMRDAIVLCRQCHGPQARDYDHGAHGGKTGSWDRSAGGQERTPGAASEGVRGATMMRNHCVDCHDPHAPAIPPTRPVLPPRDRGGAPR